MLRASPPGAQRCLATRDTARYTRRVNKTLGWACYLACSWTWCIGMFLPVLLVRDYGVWGWVVFAIPNVIGAAAMGWVIRGREQSERLLARHSGEVLSFTAITVIFHVFFAVWMIRTLLGNFALLALGVTFVWIMVNSWGPIRRSFDRYLSLAAIVISVVLFICFSATEATAFELPRLAASTFDLLALSFACTFGFVLCPYLDGTFHYAWQESAPASRATFAIGFGVLFLSMITFTLGYAPALLAGEQVSDTMRKLIGAHMLLQSCVTIILHGRVVESLFDKLSKPWRLLNGLASVSLLAVVYLAYRNPNWGETIYRLFMSFYGLYFPAYVYLCMIPRARPVSRWIGACVLATPFYYVGFIEGKMMWVLPGITIVLLARVVPTQRGNASLTNVPV